MREIRIYHNEPLHDQSTVKLSDDAFHHLVRVLRKGGGEKIVLFDGSNHIFYAELVEVTKKFANAQITAMQKDDRESPLKIHLGQVISKGEKMEWTIQKAVELGVSEFTPLISSRCNVKLSDERMDKKIAQWQKIAISAAEQCGRNVIMNICEPQTLNQWCSEPTQAIKLNLHPRATQGLSAIGEKSEVLQKSIRLLIGSEGGLSKEEIAMTGEYGFIEARLGSRVLRTETAGLATIAILQSHYGDLN